MFGTTSKVASMYTESASANLSANFLLPKITCDSMYVSSLFRTDVASRDGVCVEVLVDANGVCVEVLDDANGVCAEVLVDADGVCVEVLVDADVEYDFAVEATT